MENQNKDDDDKFYENAAKYWSDIPATLDGILGGFGSISEIDVKDSILLLKQLYHSLTPPGHDCALDCGAGIGRVSKFVLAPFFDKIDLVEQNPQFLIRAKEYISDNYKNKIGNLYAVGLQNFEPEPRKYDVIWMQWVLGYLIDDDLIKLLKRCMYSLKPNGVIVIKDNISSSDTVDKDEIDSSITRPYSDFKKIFEKAGIECIKLVKQRNFPKGLYNVYMFVLKVQ